MYCDATVACTPSADISRSAGGTCPASILAIRGGHMAKSCKPAPEGYHTITPQLTLDNAAQSIDWYKRAFGANEVMRSAAPDGKIMHAELQIGNSRLMVMDVMMDVKGPRALGGSPASFWIYTNDC